VELKKLLTAGVVAALFAGILAISGCSDTGGSGAAGGGQSGTINVVGSDTMVNMAGAWADAYQQANPNVSVTVKGGGSGVGITSLINGTTDVADSSREMKPEEITAAKAKNVDPVGTKVARDGISIVVNPANKVDGLAKDQLGRIYRGEISNWKDVGGADEPIVLLSRDNSSGTYELFKGKIVGADKNFAKAAKLLASNQAIVDEVKNNAAAIGYVGVGYADKATGIKIVALDGVKASVAAVKDGSYELSRYLYMYTNGAPTGAIKAYVDWILGADGQKIVEDQGFVTLN